MFSNKKQITHFYSPISTFSQKEWLLESIDCVIFTFGTDYLNAIDDSYIHKFCATKKEIFPRPG